MSPEKMIGPYFALPSAKLGLAKSRLRRLLASMAPAGAHLRGFLDTLKKPEAICLRLSHIQVFHCARTMANPSSVSRRLISSGGARAPRRGPWRRSPLPGHATRHGSAPPVRGGAPDRSHRHGWRTTGIVLLLGAAWGIPPSAPSVYYENPNTASKIFVGSHKSPRNSKTGRPHSEDGPNGLLMRACRPGAGRAPPLPRGSRRPAGRCARRRGP